MGWRVVAIGSLALAACGSTAAPARRYLVVTPAEGRVPPDCRATCAAFVKPGEAVECQATAIRDPLDKQLGSRLGLVCVVRAGNTP